MKLFYTILKHFFPKINIHSSAFTINNINNNNDIDNTDFYDYSFVNTYERFYNNIDNTKSSMKDIIKEKYGIYFRSVASNSFIMLDKKIYLSSIFSKCQKYYHTLNRFVYNIKLKRFFQNKNIETDLYLNDLSSFKNEQIITLVENNVIYKFRITDLMRIIKSSLINLMIL